MTPLGNSKIKKTRPMEISHEFFSNTPRNSTSSLIDPEISTCCFFNTPGNSMSSTPHPCLDFFWNSPMSMDVTLKNSYMVPIFIDWLNTIYFDKLLKIQGLNCEVLKIKKLKTFHFSFKCIPWHGLSKL